MVPITEAAVPLAGTAAFFIVGRPRDKGRLTKGDKNT
jgi:hypothetical protein